MFMSDLEAPPGLARPAASLTELSRYTLIAAALAACLAEAALAIPASLTGLLQQDIGPSSSQLTWITDAFLVPVSLFELTFGVLGDLFGRKRLLIGGALLLAVGEAIVFLSPGAGASTGTRVAVILTGQALAGIGAGALFPTSLAMIASATHTAQSRARGIAVWVSGFTLGALIGPVIGGVAAQGHYGSDVNAGWRWAFLVVPVLALVSAGVSFLAQDSSAPEGRSLDWPGQVTIAVAVFALLFAVIQGPTTGWDSWQVIGGFILAVVFTAAFVFAELRSPAPLLQLSFFRQRSFAAVSAVTVIGMFAFLGTVYSIAIRLATVQGFSPLKTSLASVLVVGMMLVLLPVAPRLLVRFATKWVLGAGLVIMGAGDVWLAATSGTDVSYGRIWAPLLLVGIGIALALASFTAGAVNGMPTHLAGMASGANNMLRDLGATLGPAVIGAVALSQAAARISSAVAASPSLRGAVAAFTGSAAHAPAAQRPALEGAVHAVQSGPLGANGVPATVTLPNGHTMPFNPLHDVAYRALTHGYSTGYVICAVAAFAAAVIACTAMSGKARGMEFTEDETYPPDGSAASEQSIS
jgi:MFS family permease